MVAVDHSPSQDDLIAKVASHFYRSDAAFVTTFSRCKSQFLRRAVCILTCVLIQPWYPALSADATNGALTPDAAQATDILGIRQDAEQIISLRSGASSGSDRHQLNNYRALVVRRVLEADLQTQAAESQLEFEIAYTYDAIVREQRKENNVNQLFNVANFTQSGTLGIIGPCADLRNEFTTESVCGLVGAGVGIILPVVGIVYAKYAKASHLTPPTFMSPYLNGKAVDGFQSATTGSALSRLARSRREHHPPRGSQHRLEAAL